MLHVKPSAQTHTAAPHCGSHCHRAPRSFNTASSAAARCGSGWRPTAAPLQKMSGSSISASSTTVGRGSARPRSSPPRRTWSAGRQWRRTRRRMVAMCSRPVQSKIRVPLFASRTLLKYHRSIPGHAIAAGRELKSSLWATTGGKGLKSAPKTSLAGIESSAEQGR